MTFPAVTAFYTGVLGLILAALSIRVSLTRARTNTLQGDGGNDAMIRSMRTQANFVEYVPLLLLMIGLLEAGGTSHIIIHAMLLILVVARIMHPIGMAAPVNSWQQFACRAPGAAATWLLLIAAAVMLLTSHAGLTSL